MVSILTLLHGRLFDSLFSTSGTIHIAYSYCQRPQIDVDQPPEVFHTRQLSYPVLVTVYHMLECHNMEILPYSAGSVSYSGDEDLDHSLVKPLEVQNPDEWCIFCIEVRNTYGIPFEVTFDTDYPGMSALTGTRSKTNAQ